MQQSRTVVDAKMSLALWLRAGRTQKGLSLEDVAKITKIQARILERLEAGKLDGLPAEVFVRGFVRSYAKCVGLEETEALQRYAAAAGAPTTIPTATRSAMAFVESMSELAPATANNVLAPVVLVSNPILPLASNQALPMFDDVDVELDDVELAPAGAVSGVAVPVVEVKAETAIEVVEVPAIDVVEAPIVEPAIVAAGAATPAAPSEASGSKKKRNRKARGTNAPKNKRKAIATGTPADATPVIAADGSPVVEAAAEATAIVAHAEPASTVGSTTTIDATTDATSAKLDEPAAADALFGAQTSTSIDPTELVDATTTTETDEVVATGETWSPKMPVVTTSSVPWRRPALGIYGRSSATTPVVPSLVIDDADPELAEREREDRADKEPTRRSFLPPILADRAKHGASGQGTLTLAVIILLIAATLTLSYLMRRPSSSGDGVTRADGTVELVG